MGLFDIFKKKISAVIEPKVEQESTQQIEKNTPKPTIIKKEIIANNQGVEFSVEVEGPPPLEELLKTAVASKQGLYPHEIIMLEYAPSYKTANNSFQQFWFYQYSVKEPQKILDSLFDRGFIKIGDLKSALEKLKIPEIKDELKAIEQKVTGKKAELIDRLLENADKEYLEKKYSERYFALTEKGESELKDNEYVSYLHRNRVMTVWEMNQRISQTHYPYRDVLWGYFNEQSTLHFQNFDFGLYRNTRLNMYRFLMEENKPKTAFQMLCEVISFDFSGLGNSEKSMFKWEQSDPEFYLEMYKSRIEQFFPYDEEKLILPPAVLGWAAELQETLGFDDNEFKKEMLESFGKVHPPRRIFTDEECANIVIASIHEDTNSLSTIFKKVEIRENAKIKEIEARIQK